ncbi:MAG: serine O-acetyltransferase [Nitrospirae bacterium]|nr:serine O-acetyltransferase [Nitrospirota bacterium]MCL5284930.1 serine O-acetyltransferase [Nitrospirota bacterium]
MSLAEARREKLKVAEGRETSLRQILVRDFRVIFERDPAARSTLAVLLTYPGYHAVVLHRIAHRLYRWRLTLLARIIALFARFLTGVEIHPAARIGPGFFIDHGMGVVIGETTVIGSDVTLYQGVSLGGTGKDRGQKRHPTLGDHVLVGAGAKILGNVTIGEGVRVGSNAVVLRSIPPHSTVVGIPGRVVRTKETGYPEWTLNHQDMPDPTQERLEQLEQAVALLSREMARLKGASPGDPPSA